MYDFMYEYIVLNVNIFVILRYFSQYCVVDLIKSIKMWQCLVSFNDFFFSFHLGQWGISNSVKLL